MLRAYRAVAAAATPLAPLLLWWRARGGKEDPARANERLGRPAIPRPAGPLLWFHAASVGETNAVLPLIAAINERAPDYTLLLTTGTVTSARLAQSQLPEGAIHQFAPLDIPRFVTAFLDHWRPNAACFAESEIWPNLVQELGRRGIPLALVNGRLSERSYRRWLGRPGMSQPLFGKFDIVLAHNEKTAERFSALGAPRVQAVGNLKADAPAPPVNAQDLDKLRSLTGKRPVLLAASIHPGEDQAVIDAHLALAKAHKGLLTIIAPRHPERGDALVQLAAAAGLSAAQRSKGGQPDETCALYVADTIGELGLFYTLAPVAFIGGSLIHHGGQNPFEAVKHHCAVVTGPSIENFADAYGALSAARGCVAIASAENLAPALDKLLGDKQEREVLDERANAALASMAGALERTLSALGPLISRSASNEEIPRAP